MAAPHVHSLLNLFFHEPTPSSLSTLSSSLPLKLPRETSGQPLPMHFWNYFCPCYLTCLPQKKSYKERKKEKKEHRTLSHMFHSKNDLLNFHSCFHTKSNWLNPFICSLLLPFSTHSDPL